MSALKQEAIQIIEGIRDDSMVEVITYLRNISSDDGSIERRRRAFNGLQSFADTLPEDFDYKRELEEAREEKYGRFV